LLAQGFDARVNGGDFIGEGAVGELPLAQQIGAQGFDLGNAQSGGAG